MKRMFRLRIFATQATRSLRRAARRPGKTVEMKTIKAETKSKVAKMESKEIRQYNTFSKRERPPMDDVVKKLGQNDLKKQVRPKIHPHVMFSGKSWHIMLTLYYSRFQIVINSPHLHRNGSCLRRATRCLSLKRSSSLGHLSERTAATSTIAFPATPGRRPPAPVLAITTTLRCSTRSAPTKRLRKGRSVFFCCNPVGASTL